MSWESYVQNLEQGTGQCQYAAILGKNDANSPLAVWAESTDKSALAPSQAELITAANACFTTDQSVYGTGIKMGGVGFTCIRLEPEVMICQGKQGHTNYSLVLASAGSTCCVGFNPTAEVKTAAVRNAVEVMKNYLKDSGY